MSEPFNKMRLTAGRSTIGLWQSAADRIAHGYRLLNSVRVHASDMSTGGLHAAEAAAPAPASTAVVTPIGAMLARHVLRDGELVLLVLKPSLWFILLSSLRFLAIVTIFALGAIAWEGRYNREWFYIEAAIFLAAGRVMWAALQWMGRLYVLTDMRVISLAGVIKIDIFDCPLRKIARTQITGSIKERVCATGTIEIIPDDETRATGIWQTIPRPVEVNELIVATINRAKQHGFGAAA